MKGIIQRIGNIFTAQNDDISLAELSELEERVNEKDYLRVARIACDLARYFDELYAEKRVGVLEGIEVCFIPLCHCDIHEPVTRQDNRFCIVLTEAGDLLTFEQLNIDDKRNRKTMPSLFVWHPGSIPDQYKGISAISVSQIEEKLQELISRLYIKEKEKQSDLARREQMLKTRKSLLR